MKIEMQPLNKIKERVLHTGIVAVANLYTGMSLAVPEYLKRFTLHNIPEAIVPRTKYRCGNRHCKNTDLPIVGETNTTVTVHCDDCHANTIWDKVKPQPVVDVTKVNWQKNQKNIMGEL